MIKLFYLQVSCVLAMMNPKTQENDVEYIVQVLESALLFC